MSTKQCGPTYQPTALASWSKAIGTSPGPPGKERLGIGRENLKTCREKTIGNSLRGRKLSGMCKVQEVNPCVLLLFSRCRQQLVGMSVSDTEDARGRV